MGKIVKLPKRDINDIIPGPLVKVYDKDKVKESEVVPLLKKFLEKIGTGAKMETKKESELRFSYPSRVLFVATKMGNTRFITELIRLYPDVIRKQDDKGRTIFHLAIKYRQEKIFNLLYEIGAMKDLVTCIKDKKGNNMLHMAAKTPKQAQSPRTYGVALQMQRELLWFRDVEKMIPPRYRRSKNGSGETPKDLFTMRHADLVTKGEQWMKEATSQSMVAAALIATITFAAAFTLPGGYNQDTGFPFFHKETALIIFVISDAVSLITSTTSVLMFLYIFLSRYAEHDFLETLPRKLVIGIATLFLSIVTMMIAFSASFFVLYHNKVRWIPITITALASIPVMFYIFLQLDLFKDVVKAAYQSKHLFKPNKKRTLYY